MRKKLLFLFAGAAACGHPPPGPATPSLVDPHILVPGVGVPNRDCRSAICPHNENTDLIRFNGAINFVHRTALGQILGDNSALHFYRSTDEGASFTETAVILAPLDNGGRDLRDPSFYIVGDVLHVKALTRLPVTSSRDTGVDTIAVESHSTDGVSWTPLQPIGPAGWSYWRVREHAGTYYTAAYQDGDLSVVLFTSPDGVTWTKGSPVYTVSADTPVETELAFMPSGLLLATVRTDGTDSQVMGDKEVSTKACWSSPPYTSFDCSNTLTGVRLDGPVEFFQDGRLFCVARKHLGLNDKKRTALYELTGDLDGGTLATKEWVVFPSAGDTSYAGVVATDGGWLVSWYSSDVPTDEPWLLGMVDASDIWLGRLTFQSVSR